MEQHLASTMAPPMNLELELRSPSSPPCESSEQALTPDEEIAVSALLMLKRQPPCEITKKPKERDSMLEDVDPWKIKKKLTESDMDLQQSRLLISTKQLSKYIFPNLDKRGIQQIKQKTGLTVSVKDCDTNDVFNLKLKFWTSSNSYVFVDGWRKNFVERRSLKKGDEIGICWSEREEQIFFSLLQRAPVVDE